jgi:DNA-binding transcriptional MocR family regulator
MSTQIVIDNFKQDFFLQTPLKSNIFQYIHYLSQTHHSVYPSQKTIADRVGCTVKYVSRVVNEYVRRGWLIVKRRWGNRATYFIPDWIKKLKLPKRKTSKEKKTYEQSKSITSQKTEIGCESVGEQLWETYVKRENNNTFTIVNDRACSQVHNPSDCKHCKQPSDEIDSFHLDDDFIDLDEMSPDLAAFVANDLEKVIHHQIASDAEAEKTLRSYEYRKRFKLNLLDINIYLKKYFPDEIFIALESLKIAQEKRKIPNPGGYLTTILKNNRTQNAK